MTTRILATIALCLAPMFQILAQSKTQDVRLLMQQVKIESTIKTLIETGISYFKKDKPNVPEVAWNDIRRGVDYSSYIDRVEQIFNDNYSHEEIQGLIVEAKANPEKLPLFKKTVQEQLYEAGKQFGARYAEYLKKALAQKGY